jgi:hypothetical protein
VIFTVPISVTPGPGTSVYAVQDQIPSGWTVSNISHSGELDPVNSQVKWGPYFDNTPRQLSYQTTPNAESAPAVSFLGFGSFDGVNVPIGGQRTARATCRLRSFTQLASGELQLNLNALLGAKFAIEASPNLKDWTSLGTVTNSYGAVQFSDPGLKNAPQRFYRAVSQ